MINKNRPTPRACHIEIQHFAIQEWRQKGDIVMEHLAGILNPSDDLTKALGWVLHSRHACHSMGHYKSGLPKASGQNRLSASSTKVIPHEAREGVGAQFVQQHLAATNDAPQLNKDTILGLHPDTDAGTRDDTFLQGGVSCQVP